MVSSGVVMLSAQALFFLLLFCCAYSAKLPVAEQPQASQLNGAKKNVIMDSNAVNAPASVAGVRSILPIIGTSDDLEIVAHAGGDGLGRQKRYIGWGRRPSLRYSKATSIWDHDNLFNKVHNPTFDKRGFGPEAPISNFRELRMKQKTPNIQVLLPHLQLRNTRVPGAGDNDVEDAPAIVSSDNERPNGARLTPEELEALAYAYLIEGDMQ